MNNFSERLSQVDFSKSSRQRETLRTELLQQANTRLPKLVRKEKQNMFIFKFAKTLVITAILVAFILGLNWLIGSFVPVPAQKGTPVPDINKIVAATFQAMTQEAQQTPIPAQPPAPTETLAPTSLDGWKTYSNSEYGFTFEYPSDKFNILGDNPIKLENTIIPTENGASRPEFGWLRYEIAITPVDSNISVADWVRQNWPNQDQANQTTININGIEAIKFQGQNLEPKSNVYVFLIKNNILIQISGHYLNFPNSIYYEKVKETWLDTTDKLLSTFRFTSESWKTYSDPKYGFSIDYPSELEITPGQDNTSLYIGEKIHVWVSDTNPLEIRGDGPLVESTEPATIAGIQATKVTGYIGAVGGNIPQRFLRYIIPRNNRYSVFTLYALSYKATSNDVATIRPLNEDDIALFEQILKTIKLVETPIPISLDHTDLQSVLKWVSYAISENKPEMFADLIGQKGVSVGRFASGFNFLGYNNSGLFVGRLREGLKNTSPICIGYDLLTSAPPDKDKSTIYYKDIHFDWTQFGLDKAVNEKIQANGFLFMKFEEGWKLVVITPIPNDILNSLSSTLLPCP